MNLDGSIEEVKDFLNHRDLIPTKLIEELSISVIRLFQAGGRLAFVGNGGSAAEAIHLAAEFTGKCIVEHKPLPAICLNESQSAITAIANDYGYENTFARVAEAQLKSGDFVIALSTSGKSPNIVKCLETCSRLGIRTILWTGIESPSYEQVEVWKAPSSCTPRIQEAHLIWGHLLAVAVEKEFLT